MCALICSTDVIAAVAIINAKKQPKLFSVVLGEGVVNDAVTIILFNAVISFAKSGKAFTGASVAVIGGDSFILSFLSLAIGILFGVMASLTFKHARSLTKNPDVECAYIFLFAYLSYITSKLITSNPGLFTDTLSYNVLSW